MKSLLLLTLVVFSPLGAFAQDAEPRGRRVVLPPSTRNPAQAARAETRPATREQAQTARVDPRERPQPQIPGLSKNVTVVIKGDLQGLVQVDLELTGCGPEFVTEFNISDAPDSDLPPTIITVSVVLTEVEGGFHANYSVGARIALVSGVNHPEGARSRNIEFRDLILRGSARMTLDEAVTVSKINGKGLQLTLTEAN